MSKPAPDSNIEWKKWGVTDPLWGVSTWPGKERGGFDPWTDDEFYQMGKADWNDFLIHWKQYGVDNDSCLEIGCGAGRITMHLASFFQKTFAVDVSEGMLSYAKDHIKNPSVSFILTDGICLPKESDSVSAVFSTHVFQHFDTLSYASEYFSEISRILRPGGTMMIHLPIYLWHPATPKLFITLLQARSHFEFIWVWIKRRLIQRGLSGPITRRLAYPIDYFFSVLPPLGFSNIELSMFSVSRIGGIHPFIFARKCSPIIQ
jgi:SAM-dependent methyltransferase